MTTETNPSTAKPKQKRKQKPPSKNALVWGSVFVFIGAVLLLLGGWSAKLGFETTKWPQVAAAVVDTKVSVSEDRNHDSRHEPRDSLVLTIAYVYDFGGREYTASGRERGVLGLENQAQTRKLTASLFPGARVTVAVNPDDPAEAYMAPGVSSLAYMSGGVGLVVLLIGMMFFATYRAARKIYLAQGDQAGR